MKSIEKKIGIKAVILAAGIGHRIRPYTDNCPKTLLDVAGSAILRRMITNIQDCGINEVIFVVGYLRYQIKDFVRINFPNLKAHFVTNERYEDTNTGFSLMLTKDYINGSTFIKFDADVVFDKGILNKLIACDYENCLCIDKAINLDAEAIKVIVDEKSRVVKASKAVITKDAAGESIGIEKISGDTAKRLFAELETMMEDKQNHQEYYEGAYERLIENAVPFYALDISGLKWMEIDTKEDFITAEKLFNESP